MGLVRLGCLWLLVFLLVFFLFFLFGLWLRDEFLKFVKVVKNVCVGGQSVCCGGLHIKIKNF